MSKLKTSDQNEQEVPASKSWWSSLNRQSIITVGIVLGLALLVVFTMRNFSSEVQLDKEDSVLATAQALAQPMIEAQACGPAKSLLPYFSGGA